MNEKKIDHPLNLLIKKSADNGRPDMSEEVTGPLYDLKSGWRPHSQHLAEESPLELAINGQSWKTILRTPGQDIFLTIGHLFTEGLINDIKNIKDLSLKTKSAHSSLNVTLGDGVNGDGPVLWSGQPDDVTEQIFSEKNSSYSGHRDLKSVIITTEPQLIIESVAALKQRQPLFQKTHGTHAVAFCDFSGKYEFTAEDISRHNAFDKVAGWGIVNKVDWRGGFLILSGRASHDMVLKALRLGVPLLACVSLPTGLARQTAEAHGLTLVQVWGDDKLLVLAGGAVKGAY